MILLFISQGIIVAEIYKWVDDNGEVHFQDYPPEDDVQSEEINNVQINRIGNQKRGTSEPERNHIPQDLDVDDPPTDSSVEKVESTVELYTTSWCRYCEKARNFFISRGISFTEYDIEKDREAALRKRQLDNRRGVPFAVINGHFIHGYSEIAYTNALRSGR